MFEGPWGMTTVRTALNVDQGVAEVTNVNSE